LSDVHAIMAAEAGVKANAESSAAAINILIWTSLRMQPAFCWLT
jgi:hypothetical protein